MPGWALLSKPDDRTWASNEGYPDVLGSHYVYDSGVGNHLRVAAGDVVVLRDSQTVHGISRIDAIDTEPAMKTRFVCPDCGRTGFDRRTSLTPKFRCGSCRAEFDTPVSKQVPVTRYTANYGSQWQPLSGLLTTDIEPALDNAKQSAIRRCDLDKLAEILAARNITVPELRETERARGSGPAHLLPMIADEAAGGPDLLGIDPDARALAALMAAKVPNPPLAIAVYGEWGEGKTFFMRRVKKEVAEFAKSDPSGKIFEPGVRQIEFGAWHYSRGNLWVSLLEHIFASLGPKDNTPDQMRDAAAASIAAIRDQVEDAARRVREKQQKVNEIAHALEEADQHHKEELKALEDARIRDAVEVIKLNGAWDETWKEIVSRTHLSEMAESIHEIRTSVDNIRSVGARASFLATSGKHWYSSPLMFGVVAALIGVLLTAAFAALAPGIYETIGPTASTIATAVATVASWLGRQSVLARQILEPAEDIQRQIDERVDEKKREQAAQLKQLTEKAFAARAEAEAAQRKLDTASKELAEAERARAELDPEKLLRRYIADRSASSDYDEHLGVVGAVHRDLSRLDAYLRAASTDPDNGTKRIILYIDDLDRCPPATVAEVLEAVHLLLALPLFVVMVGIDRRVADRAICARHPELINSDADAPTPGDYLEKIFQLKYAMPRMSADGCRAVLQAMASRRHPWIDADATKLEHTTSEPQSNLLPDEASLQSAAEEAAFDEKLIEALTYSDEDCELLDKVAPLLSVSPRRAKRFYNTLTVARARLAVEPHDTAALTLVCAVLVGAPTAVGPALRRLVGGGAPELPFGKWASDVDQAAVNSAEVARFAQFIEGAGSLLDLSMATVVDHVPMVTRFT